MSRLRVPRSSSFALAEYRGRALAWFFGLSTALHSFIRLGYRLDVARGPLEGLGGRASDFKIKKQRLTTSRLGFPADPFRRQRLTTLPVTVVVLTAPLRPPKSTAFLALTDPTQKFNTTPSNICSSDVSKNLEVARDGSEPNSRSVAMLHTLFRRGTNLAFSKAASLPPSKASADRRTTRMADRSNARLVSGFQSEVPSR
mmetsp:Transcript_1667/g.2998  ORF Transcript_1667/g.2998 Transcript_1667/m.2998 type:complete len:200 (-) Transcript_1667:2938-3537(-)